MHKVDVADLDCIYLSYDEPKKEEIWVKIQNLVPWAKRVDGVKGSDAAHKACADASDTDRFVLIDGDNIPYAKFFDETMAIPDELNDCVFRWKARNVINGLMYGNGGLSCWTKDFVYNMRTHENSDGADENEVEFCFDPKYLAMQNVYSDTHPNGSAFHSWRAGFREGVKMCLERGTKPSLEEFEKKTFHRNFDHLLIWQCIGRDESFGLDAMMGARFGTYLTMIEDWDHTEVQDFDEIERIYKNEYNPLHMEHITQTLKKRLGLKIEEFTDVQSTWFKHFYIQSYFHSDIMTLEKEILKMSSPWW